MTVETIKGICRAEITDRCLGKGERPIEQVYPDGPEDDRTWDGKTVVCDSCYIAMGLPLFNTLEQLEQILERYKT